MSTNQAAQQLRQTLCELFDHEEDALRVAEDAGLSRATIRIGGSVLNTWAAILKEAERHNTVGNLVHVAIQLYPTHQVELDRLWQSFQAQLPDAPAQYTERRITHLLPFAKINGQVRLLEIERLQAHKGISEMTLNLAIVNSGKRGAPLAWNERWRLPMHGDGSPVTGDAVTVLYDLLEWLVVQEIAAYGNHLYAGAGGLRPGDDFDHMPQEVVRAPRATLFPEGIRPNYLWQYGNNPQQQLLKLPPETTVTLRSLPPSHGVKTFNGAPVRRLTVRNPVGSLTVTPSQIWRKATSNQARSMLGKMFAEHKEMYPLEFQLLTVVAVQPNAATSPAAAWSAAGYERWLLELQEQMLRHMDWDRYVEADYRRRIIKLTDGLDE